MRSLFWPLAAALLTAGLGVAGSSAPRTALAQLSSQFEQLAHATSPAVVQINVSGYTILSEDENRVGALTREKGVGSGVILSPDGYIVTNAHVVRNAQTVTVTFTSSSANEEACPARIVGVDPRTDLALLKIDREGLPFLKLADSGQVHQGQLVVAFGSPLGLSNSMTMGMVSSPARQLDDEDLVEYIQTDAAINPGNSGGPLVNAAGDVIGLNTMILSQSGGNEGVGLAIPSNVVQGIVTQLKTRGHVHRGMIGANAQTITPELAAGLSLPPAGAVISDMADDGPAGTAGVKIGDVVVKVDGNSITSARQLELAVFQATLGQTLQLEISREGRTRTIGVTVGERMDSADLLASLPNPQERLIPQLGVMGVLVDPQTAAAIPNLREPSGVLVMALTREATAWTVQLQPGDIIHSLNGSPVMTLEFLRDKLGALKSGAAVVLQIERDGILHFIPLRAE